MIAFLRFELIRTLRNARFLVMLIVFPVALYLIYGTQKGTAQNLTIGTPGPGLHGGVLGDGIGDVRHRPPAGPGAPERLDAPAAGVADLDSGVVRRQAGTGHLDDHPRARDPDRRGVRAR